MAFYRDVLIQLGGFDRQFRAAGDDVDICWRIRERGMTVGFSPAAMVWHHRRNSVRAYLKQQVGYGKAEALLEQKWSEKYNAAGHLTWAGRLYGRGFAQGLGWWRNRVYQGVWGSAPFQSVYEPAPNLLYSMSLMPEWYMIIGLLAIISALGLSWTPLLLAVPLLVLACMAVLAQAARAAAGASFPNVPPLSWTSIRMRLLVAALHAMQPAARLYGRLKYGLTPWRWGRRRPPVIGPCLRCHVAVWSERWQSPDVWLQSVESTIRSMPGFIRRGGDFDHWDLEVRGGMFGAVRLTCVVEEHGNGRQMARFRFWPSPSHVVSVTAIIIAGLAILAASGGAVVAAFVLATLALWLGASVVIECSAARAMADAAIEKLANGQAATRAKPLFQGD